ncbi:beta-ketoadipyl CoA thiolase [Microbacterium sp. Leaf288]|uniref:thiolase family protein n=1 Tax=Microbacterium sp. Leaf288 TaxID=1736323 RepID=UPI0006FAEDD9|nr:thiolase family protein [Microbacterium sp. Leaf288]KQP69996.1 beta-ketoadipyl CoA thiolase [Microbacterium sp. Leaf288]
MNDVYLVAGARTPQGRYGGALAEVRPDDLAALVVAEAAHRAGIPLDAVDEVVLGAANQAGEDNRNVARMAVLLAGLPETVPGYTVNRLCASGLTAVASAFHAIRSGEAEVVIAGGVESMTRAPWVMAKPGTPWAKPGELADTALGWRFTNLAFLAHDDDAAASPEGATGPYALSMGETAEEVARHIGISREESDLFALQSQQRAARAISAGRFRDEIVAVPVKAGIVDEDETPRPGTTLERLARLAPAFRPDGVVTAGSSSPLSDGAAALVLASGDAVRRYQLDVRGRIVASASAGVAPHLMGLGPVPATQKALQRAGWSIDDVGAIELNEAFAVQSLGVMAQLGLDARKVNADGGAIALGHPLGCSGARILLTLLGRMEREKADRGLATLCVGVGQGVAMLVETA